MQQSETDSKSKENKVNLVRTFNNWRRYRETVLANGGQLAPEELLRQFLGRPSDSRAFFEALKRQ